MPKWQQKSQNGVLVDENKNNNVIINENSTHDGLDPHRELYTDTFISPAHIIPIDREEPVVFRDLIIGNYRVDETSDVVDNYLHPANDPINEDDTDVIDNYLHPIREETEEDCDECHDDDVTCMDMVHDRLEVRCFVLFSMVALFYYTRLVYLFTV